MEVVFDKEKRFQFSEINGVFNTWYKKQFAQQIVKETLQKLKKDMIFKMGFMVNSLVDEFLELNLTPSYLEEIPVRAFSLPVKSYQVNFGGISEEEEEAFFNKLAENMLQVEEIKTREDFVRIGETNYFEGFDFVKDNSLPLIDETIKVSISDFTDAILNSPKFLNNYHVLNSIDGKIPGLLDVNSQASRVLQSKFNDVFLEQIDNLIRYQNIYINLIDWEELTTF